MATYRTVLLTILFTGLGMAFGLFCGIIITALRHHPMNEAYRVISIPVAVTSGTCAFVFNVVREVRKAVGKG
jgi:ABC-type amino acid transport system permease subunit